MSGGFDVEVADLTRHAGSVDEIRGRVAEAQSAGAGVDLHGGAFGLMCGFLIGSVQDEDQAAVGALSGMVSALQSTATDLRAMAEDYRRSDEAAATRMAQLMKEMDR